MLAWQISKSAVKRAQNMQLLFCNSCYKTSWKAMLRVLPPTFKPISKKMKAVPSYVNILTSDWIKLRGSHTIRGSCFTCCKTSLPWVGKTRNMWRGLLQKVELLSTFCNKFSQPATTWFVSRHVWTWVVKRATSLFNSFCSQMFQNKLHVFVRLFYRTLFRFFPFLSKINWKGYSHSTEWFEEITGK